MLAQPSHLAHKLHSSLSSVSLAGAVVAVLITLSGCGSSGDNSAALANAATQPSAAGAVSTANVTTAELTGTAPQAAATPAAPVWSQPPWGSVGVWIPQGQFEKTIAVTGCAETDAQRNAIPNSDRYNVAVTLYNNGDVAVNGSTTASSASSELFRFNRSDMQRSTSSVRQEIDNGTSIGWRYLSSNHTQRDSVSNAIIKRVQIGVASPSTGAGTGVFEYRNGAYSIVSCSFDHTAIDLGVTLAGDRLASQFIGNRVRDFRAPTQFDGDKIYWDQGSTTSSPSSRYIQLDQVTGNVSGGATAFPAGTLFTPFAYAIPTDKRVEGAYEENWTAQAGAAGIKTLYYVETTAQGSSVVSAENNSGSFLGRSSSSN